MIVDKIALILVIVGALNWGGVGALLISPRAKVSWASCSSSVRRRAARRALPLWKW